jgi:hypothetical protein
MNKTIKRRIAFVVIALIISGIVIIDSVGVFDDGPYIIIPHGNHVHYVPRDRDQSIPLDAFPTVEPRPGERIMPNGTVVRETP